MVVLRHDVDRLPKNSLLTAQMENRLGIKGTYYFRIVPESYDEKIMEKIARLGHEIGYHYEDMDLVARLRRLRGTMENGKWKMEDGKWEMGDGKGESKGYNFEDELIDLAYESFCRNLEKMRQNFDIKTICMHGSPRSKYDNKLIWKKYNYRELGIIGEPYFDIDWNQFGYLTDTGRRWNGERVSVRDKVDSKFKLRFKSTHDVIAGADQLPPKLMITIHPQRWTNQPLLWLREVIAQNVKNVVKAYVVRSSG